MPTPKISCRALKPSLVDHFAEESDRKAEKGREWWMKSSCLHISNWTVLFLFHCHLFEGSRSRQLLGFENLPTLRLPAVPCDHHCAKWRELKAGRSFHHQGCWTRKSWCVSKFLRWARSCNEQGNGDAQMRRWKDLWDFPEDGFPLSCRLWQILPIWRCK